MEPSETFPPLVIDFTPKTRSNGNKWDSAEDDPLWLLTLEEFALVPEGSTLDCINGRRVVKGVDYIDDETRYGVLAYGVRESQLPAWVLLHG